MPSLGVPPVSTHTTVHVPIMSHAALASNGKKALSPPSALLGTGTAPSVSLCRLLVSAVAGTGCSEYTVELNGTYCPLKVAAL